MRVNNGGHGSSAAGTAEGKRRVVVGVVADPGLVTEIVEHLKDGLPPTLVNQVSDEVEWEVCLKSEALPLDEDGNIAIWENSSHVKSEEEWDVLVCVTELTRRSENALLVSDVSISGRAALISLPALGPVRVRRHLREVMVRVLQVIVDQDMDIDRRAADDHSRGLHSRFMGHAQQETIDDGSQQNSALVISGVRSHIRVALGMVRINRPWRLVTSLTSALAAGIATAAFGVFYSTIWQMADSLPPYRLLFISLVAVGAMCTWLILYNGLWERDQDLTHGRYAAVYNAATVMTLLIGVTCLYLVLFVVILAGALIIIPSEFLEQTLQHESTMANYVSVAWLASSLGTFAGALGSTFESDDAVREATYGKREQERHAIKDSTDG